MNALLKRIVNGATSIPALATLGASATLALLLHSVAIGGVGVLATCAFIGVDSFKKTRASVLPRSMLGDSTRLRLRDPQTRAAVLAILEARTGLERTLEESTESLAVDLAPALAQVSELDARATKLAERAEEIAAFLGKKDFAALQREVAELAQRVLQTKDHATRELYAEARSARGDQLATLFELVRTKERIAATLLSIAASLDALGAKIVRLRGLDGPAADATHDVRRDLAAMTEELASFEQTLLHLNEVS